jgi:hypothetical protein
MMEMYDRNGLAMMRVHIDGDCAGVLPPFEAQE